jgi:hypothetical protein
MLDGPNSGLREMEPMPDKKIKVRIPPPESSEKDGIQLGVSESNEKWSEYVLEDSTVIRVKPNVVGAVRIEGEFDLQGNPAYLLQMQPTVIVVSARDELKKAAEEPISH